MLRTRMIRFFSNIALPNLKFEHGSLEPVLSKEAMELHHQKHHQTYVNNYNKLSQELEEANQEGDFLEAAVLQKKIAFNLGGHINHSLYWENLSPVDLNGGILPNAESHFMKDFLLTFDSFEEFQAEFNKKALGVMGSGWAWLVYETYTQQMKIVTTMNQDTVGELGYLPLLSIDVWEHAYYVNYQNMRATYMGEI